MRLYLYRVSVVVVIIGLALIGRGLGMRNTVYLWIGVSLFLLSSLSFLLSRRYRPTGGTRRGERTSTDTPG